MNTELKYHPDLIISTKLNQPPVVQDLVLRGKLHAQLNQGLNRKLTLVSAPAGFGKTTLIGSWLKSKKIKTSWLSLDQQDNGLLRFFKYLEASVDPSNQILSDCLFDHPHSPNQEFSEALLQRILQALVTQQPFGVLVLDDYHLITNPDVHNAVNFILTNLPKPEITPSGGGRGCHIMILSRSDPSFPLSRWRLNGELNEIRTDDLRFSLEEAAELLNQNLQLGLALDDVAELKSRAEGWVAGLQLAAVSMRGQKTKSHHQFIGELKGSYRMLSDYLIEEVYLQQPPNIQEFLLKTSILERMNGDLCDDLLLSSNSQAILELLERNNVFVVPLDHERNWYRYHHLFSDALTAQLKTISDNDLAGLHSRAATWLADHDYFEDSVKHWLIAEDYDAAAQLVVGAASQILNQGRFYDLRSLLEQFPDEAYLGRPWLSMFRGWACFMLEPDEIESWLTISESDIRQQSRDEQISPAEANEVLGNIYAIRAIIASRFGDHESTLDLAPQALKLLPERDTKVRGLVFNALGTSGMLRGKKKEALEYFMEGKTILRKGGNLGGAADALQQAGGIQMDLGRLHLATSAFREAISLQKYDSDSEPCYTSQGYTGLGEVLFEWNDIDGAFLNFETGYRFSQRMGTTVQISCAMPLAQAWMEWGEMDKAEEILKNYAPYMGNPTLGPQADSQLVACQIHWLALAGEHLSIGHLVGSRGISLDGTKEIFREPEFAAYARYLLMRGDLKQAVHLASILEQNMAAIGCAGRQIRLLATMATAFRLLGENVSAINTAAQLVNLAAKAGYIRTFVSLGEPMLELLVDLSKNQAADDYHLDRVYLGEVISAFFSSPEKGVMQSSIRSMAAQEQVSIPGLMVEALTDRELEVLRLITVERSNTEIANILNISINTVKTHTSNIYSKLGVSNRLQAANRARQLRIL